MKYMGSKARIAKKILPIILRDRKEGQCYVEPFVGGANMIDKVDGWRIGADSNKYIISMWRSLADGWTPDFITKNDYDRIKKDKDMFGFDLVGWVGIACSYSGKWFGGFAGRVNTKVGFRDYQDEAHRNVKKQLPLLSGVEFLSSCYQDLEIPSESLIYCDPPYANTTKYKDDFDHGKFWQWCREKATQGHKIFVSEYNAPDDFVCVWEAKVKSSLSANGRVGGNKTSIERLFVHKSQQ